MSLHDIVRKIKPLLGFAETSENEMIEFNEDGEVEHSALFQKLFLATVIILTALLSFGFGRLSVAGKREPIKIDYDLSLINQTANVVNATKPSGESTKKGSVVASKNGLRYHYPHCPGAKQIREDNKIIFATPAAAEASGFTLALNCSPR